MAAVEDLKGGVTVAVSLEGLAGLLAKIPDDLKRRRVAHRMLRAVGLRVEAKAKTRAPVRTGNLRRSIHSFTVSDFREEVRVDARYGPFVEGGTGLFGPRRALIYPTTKKAMAWHGGTTGPGGNLRLTGVTRAGQPVTMVVRRSTKGMKAHPYLGVSWEDVQSQDLPKLMEAAAMQLFGRESGAA